MDLWTKHVGYKVHVPYKDIAMTYQPRHIHLDSPVNDGTTRLIKVDQAWLRLTRFTKAWSRLARSIKALSRLIEVEVYQGVVESNQVNEGMLKQHHRQ